MSQWWSATISVWMELLGKARRERESLAFWTFYLPWMTRFWVSQFCCNPVETQPWLLYSELQEETCWFTITVSTVMPQSTFIFYFTHWTKWKVDQWQDHVSFAKSSGDVFSLRCVCCLLSNCHSGFVRHAYCWCIRLHSYCVKQGSWHSSLIPNSYLRYR